MKYFTKVLLVLTLFVGYAFSANLRGTVKDADSGEPLIGANVVVTGTSMGATTDGDGFFLITNLQPGEYTVEISYLGYSSSRQTITMGTTTTTMQISLASVAISSSAINVVSNRARERETPVAFTDVSKEEIQQQLGSRDIPLVLNTTPSIYATENGGGAGDARINLRGFNQRNVAIMINGVPVNDMENGWVYWSNWDGVGDATQSIQVQRGLSAVNLAAPSIGGTINIITDPTAQQFGGMFKQEAGRDGFLKSTASVHTGLINNKFAVSASVVRKLGDGIVDATWTDNWAYYFGAAYNLNQNNRLELYALGAPQRHGQNLYRQNIGVYSSTLALEQDDYDPNALRTFNQAFSETNKSRLYNETWNKVSPTYTGKQSTYGNTFDRHDPNFINERENFYHKPQVNLNWFSRLSNQVNLYSILYYSGGKGGGSGTFGSLVWDYDSFPSRIADWDATIARNIANSNVSRGILRNSNNQQWTVGAIVKTEYKMDNSKFTVGVDWRTAEIDHFRDVRDLLGGDYYDARSRGGVSDFWTTDADFQRRLGDRLDYDNTNKVNWIGGFLQDEYTKGKMSAYGMFGYSGIKYDFTDHFRAARDNADGTPDLSSGEFNVKSDWITGYQLKGGASYRLNEALDVFGNVGVVSKVPIFDDVIDDGDGTLRQDFNNEDFTSFEGGVNFSDPDNVLGLSITGYYTKWNNRAQRRGVTIRDEQQDIDITVFLDGIDALHAGLELMGSVNLHRMFGIDAMASFGKWEHTSDAGGDFRVYGGDEIDLPESTNLKFALDGLRVGDAPQTQYSVTGNFRPVKGFNAQLTYRYYANFWADWDPFDRVYGESIGLLSGDRAQSWKVPNYGIMDLHVSYELPLNFGSVKPRLFVHAFNLLDELYITDALDNSSFNAYRDNGVNHSADDAEVYVGLPRYVNGGLQINF